MDFQQVDSGFPFLAGSWIPKAGFWIPEPSIPDSTSKNFLDSGIRITLHGAKHCYNNSLGHVPCRSNQILPFRDWPLVGGFPQIVEFFAYSGFFLDAFGLRNPSNKVRLSSDTRPCLLNNWRHEYKSCSPWSSNLPLKLVFMDDTACLSSSGLSSSDTPRRSVWKREEISPEAEIVSTDAIFVWRRLRQCRLMWPAPSDVLKLCRRMIWFMTDKSNFNHATQELTLSNRSQLILYKAVQMRNRCYKHFPNRLSFSFHLLWLNLVFYY